MNNLPQGWVECEMREIGEIVSGGTPSTKDPENFGGKIAWLTPADLSDYHKKYISKGNRNITEKGLKSSSAKLMPAGSILFSSRAPIGYTVIANNEICTNQGFKNIVPYIGIYNEFIYYFLKSAKKIVEQFASGTTFKEISGSKFGKILIKLPPLNEQKRIVEKIEEEFGKIDEGIEKLKLVQEQIKQYKQSVLKSAFEDKLYKTTEWEKFKIKDIAINIQYGYTESSSMMKIGPKFLRITDIQNNKVNWKTVPYCKINSDIKNKYLLKNGDLLFARTGATVGKSYLVDNIEEESVYASYLIRIRFKEDINVKFIKYYFQTDDYWRQIIDNQSGIGQPNVNGTKLASIGVKIPLLQDQQKIVEEIEKRFEVADNVAKIVEENLEKAEQLKQSILKKAFEGRLVPQDPTDEPASVLLERIKKERTKNA